MLKKAEFYTSHNDYSVTCRLCPKECQIKNNSSGFCKVRKNIDGVLYTNQYASVAAINIDPMEKKPLYHFYPASTVLSIGAYGCNMSCGFCQNHHISVGNGFGQDVDVEQIISFAINHNCPAIACTYNEPVVWYEFMYDIFKISKNNGLKNVLVTNGMINHEPLKTLIDVTDAANIDLKTFSQNSYKNLNGSLQTVKNTIKTFKDAKKHIEISSLAVPDLWDDNIFEEMCRWLADIDAFIPLHINRYFPSYKYSLPPTRADLLVKFKNIADKYLNYVYIGNLDNNVTNNTKCHVCGATLIERKGYESRLLLTEKKCLKCSANIPIYL